MFLLDSQVMMVELVAGQGELLIWLDTDVQTGLNSGSSFSKLPGLKPMTRDKLQDVVEVPTDLVWAD